MFKKSLKMYTGNMYCFFKKRKYNQVGSVGNHGVKYGRRFMCRSRKHGMK